MISVLAFLLAAATGYVPIYQAMPSRAVLKQPVPELKQIAYMAGTWRCHAYSFATGKVPSRDTGYTVYTAKFIMRNLLNGHPVWLQISDARQRDLSFITYDSLAKRWVLTGIEWPVSSGTEFGTMRGNKLIVTGSVTVFGRDYHLRTTYTKQSNDRFTLLNEEQRPDGSWLRDDEYDYVRVKP